MNPWAARRGDQSGGQPANVSARRVPHSARPPARARPEEAAAAAARRLRPRAAAKADAAVLASPWASGPNLRQCFPAIFPTHSIPSLSSALLSPKAQLCHLELESSWGWGKALDSTGHDPRVTREFFPPACLSTRHLRALGHAGLPIQTTRAHRGLQTARTLRCHSAGLGLGSRRPD